MKNPQKNPNGTLNHHKLLMTRLLWLALVKWSVLEPLVSGKLLFKVCKQFNMAKQIRLKSNILCTVDLNRESKPQTLPSDRGAQKKNIAKGINSFGLVVQKLFMVKVGSKLILNQLEIDL